MYYTYILYSEYLSFFYKGSTNNIDNRLKRHNAGLETFTSNGTPWVLIWFTIKETKSDAYKLEMKLKNLSQKRIIQFITKYHEGIVDPHASCIKAILKFADKVCFRQHPALGTKKKALDIHLSEAFFLSVIALISLFSMAFSPALKGESIKNKALIT